MYNSNYDMRTGAAIAIIAIAVLLCVFGAILHYQSCYENPHWETITVKDKDVNPGEQTEMWLVYTKDEVYCITDLVWAGFFTSSDVYNAITPGKTYHVYVSGRRMPEISGYKVIRKAEEVKDEGRD